MFGSQHPIICSFAIVQCDNSLCEKKVPNNGLNHTFALPLSNGGCQNLLHSSRGAFQTYSRAGSMQTKCIRGHSNATSKQSHKSAYAHFIPEQSCKPHAEVSYSPLQCGALPATKYQLRAGRNQSILLPKPVFRISEGVLSKTVKKPNLGKQRKNLILARKE